MNGTLADILETEGVGVVRTPGKTRTKHHIVRFHVDITTERIDFEVPGDSRVLYCKEVFDDPGTLTICFEVDEVPLGHICPEPTKYTLVGRGYKTPFHKYQRVRNFEMQDGCRWGLYVDLRP